MLQVERKPFSLPNKAVLSHRESRFLSQTKPFSLIEIALSLPDKTVSCRHAGRGYCRPNRLRDGHFATHFLPNEVGILKFCAADMCTKNRKNIGIRGSNTSFEAF